MKVSGPLREPLLEPCPNRNDLKVKVTRKEAAPSIQPVNKEKVDCCNYWVNAPNTWCNDVVPITSLDPENFKYSRYRYQIYAKPAKTICEADVPMDIAKQAADRQYVPAQTDIRGLQQTMYIPVVPTKPGGETEATFPMTSRTMGQPDVTTACCVPTIPVNPGFRNLTSDVYPDPRLRCDPCMYTGAPNKQPGNACLGFKGTFPPSMHEYGRTGIAGFAPPEDSNRGGSGSVGSTDGRAQRQIPGRTETYEEPRGGKGCYDNTHELCIGEMDDDPSIGGGNKTLCTNVKAFRYDDRVTRAISEAMETPEERTRRLKTMFGAYGANLMAHPKGKRTLKGPVDQIKIQGNGFNWEYPKTRNTLCYVLERNPRC